MCDTIYVYLYEGKLSKFFYALCYMLSFIVTKLKKQGGRANYVIVSPCDSNLKVVNIVQEGEKYLPFCRCCSVASKGNSSFSRGADTVFVDWCSWGY